MLIRSTKKQESFIKVAMPFGAGALLAAAFFGLIPEAMHKIDSEVALLWVLFGFLAFFTLERGLSWFHHHHHDDVYGSKNQTHSTLVVIGDTLHNAIDGVALGAAFLVSPVAGIGAAIAIAAHEIPQEIGDFGILLSKGMKPKNVIIVNTLSALVTVIAAMSTFTFGQSGVLDVSIFLAIAAGFFIYVAAADIIPDIHERPQKEALLQITMLILGVFVIGYVLNSTEHSHSHPESDDSSLYESEHNKHCD